MKKYNKYCPFCTSKKQMRKNGFAGGKGKSFVQRWECTNCGRNTIKPLTDK